jgi:hypothetical protein
MPLGDWVEIRTLQLIVGHLVSSTAQILAFWVFDKILRLLFSPEDAVIQVLVYLEDFAFLVVFAFLVWNVGAEFWNRRVRLNGGNNVPSILLAFAL